MAQNNGFDGQTLRSELVKEWRAARGVNTTVTRFNVQRSKNLHARQLCRALVKPVEQCEIEMMALDAVLMCRKKG